MLEKVETTIDGFFPWFRPDKFRNLSKEGFLNFVLFLMSNYFIFVLYQDWRLWPYNRMIICYRCSACNIQRCLVSAPSCTVLDCFVIALKWKPYFLAIRAQLKVLPETWETKLPDLMPTFERWMMWRKFCRSCRSIGLRRLPRPATMATSRQRQSETKKEVL